jgi:hypothetical protein
MDANKADIKPSVILSTKSPPSGTSGKPYLMFLTTAKKSPAANFFWQNSKA